MRGLLDTSVFVATEQMRELGKLPDEAAISVVTVAELHLGVLLASSAPVRAQRLRTLAQVEHYFDPLPIDENVARTFAELVATSRKRGKKLRVMDGLIAATAVANGLSVYSQDDDFGGILGVKMVKV